MSLERVELIRDLLLCQHYVSDVTWCPLGHEDHDLNGFRDHSRSGRNLADMHLATMGLGPEYRSSAWLKVDEVKAMEPVILHRSFRYRNPSFPWQRIIDKYRSQCLLVGLPEERDDFVRLYGKVSFYQPKEYLELAQIIAGARLFIGNQSSPEAVCEGLKQNKILEVSPSPGVCDSCRFNRLGALYVDGDAVLEFPTF